jgi:hypothetical protein
MMGCFDDNDDGQAQVRRRQVEGGADTASVSLTRTNKKRRSKKGGGERKKGRTVVSFKFDPTRE